MTRVVLAESTWGTAREPEEKRRPVRSLVRVALVIAAHLAGFEVVAYLSAQLLRERNMLYSPPETAGYVTYLQERDPILGWPSKAMLHEMYDEEGARRNPYYPVPHKPCVSVYGDSATYAEKVSDSDAWSAQLSRQLGCRVANHGVPGYGTDQAYLRFSLNERDEAPVVVLNHFSGDIRRNVNQLRNLLVPNSQLMLKPRFVAEEGGLRLIPLPQLSASASRQLRNAPAAVVEHEYFLPGKGRGIIEAKFPYLLSVASLFLSDDLSEQVGQQPVWAAFYDREHPSRALDITVAIIKRFVAEAATRGKEGIVAIIPDPADLRHFALRGKFPYAPLVSQLEAEGIAVLDAGAALIESLKGRDACELSSTAFCSGSFNVDGHKLLAQVFLSVFAVTQDQDRGMELGVDVLGAVGHAFKSPRLRRAGVATNIASQLTKSDG
jgi:hypothetical protein